MNTVNIVACIFGVAVIVTLMGAFVPFEKPEEPKIPKQTEQVTNERKRRW